MYGDFHCTEDGDIKYSIFSDQWCTTFYQGTVSLETALEKTFDHSIYSVLSDSSTRHTCDQNGEHSCASVIEIEMNEGRELVR